MRVATHGGDLEVIEFFPPRENMNRILLVGLLLSGACNRDPAMENLESFRAFVAKEYPGGTFPGSPFKANCTLRADVQKTTSVASPYEGLLSGVMTLERVVPPMVRGEKAEPIHRPLRGVMKFELHFAREGNQWVCDGTKGFRTLQQDDEPESRMADPCVRMPPACLGKPIE